MIRGMRRIEIGGLYGINIEILSGNKTLMPRKNKIYQYFDEGGANRVISLSTVGAIRGSLFIVKHNGDGNDTHYLDIQENGTSIDKIYARGIKEFIFDGTNWIGVSVGVVDVGPIGIGWWAAPYDGGIAIGQGARGHTEGIAIGIITNGYTYGVGVGYDCDGYTYGVALGHSADAHDKGVAVGYAAIADSEGTALSYYSDTNANRYSITLGHYAKCTRYAELAINIDEETDQENQMMIGSWTRETIDNTPASMWCGTSPKRFTIRASSALSFKIMVTARDNTTGDCAAYLFKGIIKRDASNNTTLVDSNKTVLHEDDATWDCDVNADDTNEALRLTVTGDADNVVQWAARVDGVETHF